MTATCAEARALLPARPVEALDEDERAFLDEHLDGCSKCRERAAALEAAFEPLGSSGAAPVANGNVAHALSGDAPSGDALSRDALGGDGDALWGRIVRALDEPAAAAEATGALASSVLISLVCSFCRGAIARHEAAYCASCLAPHHGDCFREHGRCSTFGCEETRTVRAERSDSGSQPARARPQRLGRFVVVALVGGFAAAALVQLTAGRHERAQHLAELQARDADLRASRARIDVMKAEELERERWLEAEKQRLVAQSEALKKALGEELSKLRDRIRVLDPSAFDHEGGAPIAARASAAELETRIEAILRTLETLGKAAKAEELIPQFLELDRQTRAYAKLGALGSPGKLTAWNTRLEEWTEIRGALKLQLSIIEGNEYLEAMYRSKRAELWADLRASATELAALVARMRADPGADFRRNADAFAESGRTLTEDAWALEAIARIQRGEAPSMPVAGVGGAGPPTAMAEGELEARVESLFSELVALCRQDKLADLAPRIQELDAIMSRHGTWGVEKVRLKIKQWDKRLEEWQDVRRTLELHISILEGRGLLAAMGEARKLRRWGEVSARLRSLEALEERLRKVDRDEFRRSAEAFATTGQAIADECAVLEKVEEIQTGWVALPAEATVADDRSGNGAKLIEYHGVRFTVDAETWRAIQSRATDARSTEPMPEGTWRAGSVVVGDRKLEGLILEKDGRIFVRQRSGIQIQLDARNVGKPVYPDDGK